MIPLYVSPLDNPCPPGTGSTYTTELGKHCVELIQDAPTRLLATTGYDGDLLVGGIGTAILFMLGGGILFAYNHLRNKERKDNERNERD